MMLKQIGSGALHTETVATYVIDGQHVEVDLCWQGKEPEQDADRFYDLFDADGVCLNEGSPFHDDGESVPTIETITEFLNPKGGE